MYLREHTRVISVLFRRFPISVYTGMPKPRWELVCGRTGVWFLRVTDHPVSGCEDPQKRVGAALLNHGPPTPNGHKQDTTPCMLTTQTTVQR